MRDQKTWNSRVLLAARHPNACSSLRRVMCPVGRALNTGPGSVKTRCAPVNPSSGGHHGLRCPLVTRPTILPTTRGAAAYSRESAPGDVRSSRLDDLPPVIGAAGWARGVRQLRVAALRALDKGRRRGLPLRTPMPRVAARLLPLWDGHLSPPGFLLVGPVGPAAPPTSGRRRRAGDRARHPPAVHHIPSKGRDSRPGTAGTTAVRAPPRP
jgi:hypothetical protein